MTIARDEQIDVMQHMPADESERILHLVLIDGLGTCDVAKMLGISEMDAETRYQMALTDLQRWRRHQIDGALLVWDGRDHTGKARFGGVSVALDRPPEIGVHALRKLDYIPGRFCELRSSGQHTRSISEPEMVRIQVWLRKMAVTLRGAMQHLLADEYPVQTAQPPHTDCSPLE